MKSFELVVNKLKQFILFFLKSIGYVYIIILLLLLSTAW